MKAEVGEQALRRARAAAAKELGNDAFKRKAFAEAVAQYTAAIEADNTQASFFSNRSVHYCLHIHVLVAALCRSVSGRRASNLGLWAILPFNTLENLTAGCMSNVCLLVLIACRAAAHAALGDFVSSRSDAATCCHLSPNWHKAWVRLGTAHIGLEDWGVAKDAFAKALALEPDDKSVQQLWAQADYSQRQHAQSDRIAFNPNVRRKMRKTSDARGKVTVHSKLSFAASDEEEDGNEAIAWCH